MRFKNFLQEWNQPHWKYRQVAKKSARVGRWPYEIEVRVLTKDGVFDSVEFSISIDDAGKNITRHPFYNEPLVDVECDAPVPDEKLKIGLEQLYHELEGCDPEEANQIFETEGRTILKRFAGEAMLKSMYDGDEKLGESVLDHGIQPGKMLHETIVMLNANDVKFSRQYIRMIEEPTTDNHAYGYLYGIGNIPMSPGVKKITVFKPQWYFSIHSDTELTEQYLDKMFKKIVNSFQEYFSTCYSLGSVGLALDTAVSDANEDLRKVQMLGDMFDGDDDNGLTDKLRKHLK